MCKTLKTGGFECVPNNLKGAGRRGFFGFRITLSLFFFLCIPSSVNAGFLRSPTRTVHVREGDSRRETLQYTIIYSRPVHYYYSVAVRLVIRLVIALTNGNVGSVVLLYMVL